MTEHYLEVLDPRGIPVHDTHDLAERPNSLHEVRLGILSNTKPNGDLLLTSLQHTLGERFHFTEVLYRNKGTSTPAPAEVMDTLAECDIVLNAVGD